jgi:thymidylate synthase
LRDQVTLSINLHDDNEGDRNLLPVTTLRKLYPMAAILEAIWYLRGENHIRFLQKHGQKFWDKQARDEGWVGLNYGLLTYYPSGCSGKSINQLEEKVLMPLCAGKKSRNMVCTFCKPDEDTLQEACTSSVQFTVSTNNSLDMTVTQRSSDAILGLPNDVFVWSIILHLVRREVRLRTKGNIQLKAGRLYFCIAAGGSHAYDINSESLKILLEREPKKGVMPHLIIDESLKDVGMMALARDYDKNFENREVVKLRVEDYVDYHPRLTIEQAL